MENSFCLSSFRPVADGVSDDTAAFQACFAAAAQAGGGVVTIPPGNYFLAGRESVPLSSGTTVLAHGARFLLPATLGERARVVLFAGRDVVDFAWFGGHFQGHCFDHRRPPNSWEPNANTRALAVSTSAGGRTANLRFRDLSAHRIAGAVVNVEGVKRAGAEREVDTFAANVSVQDCTFLDCGKFMWDYGLLWQIITWPEEYAAADVAMAYRYFPASLLRPHVRLEDGDDRVRFDNRADAIPASRNGGWEGTVSFLGSRLPANLVRGRRYFVVEAGPEFLRVAAEPGGQPLRFAGSAGPDTGLIHNLSLAFYHLFQPAGAGPGKGGIDLVACRNTTLSGNRLSALGDTMHLQCCHNNVFSGNQILGSRMGAFFLAEFCCNSTVTGNTVDGTNGSRVMSIEKSNTDVTVIGNTFRNGGRGSWINQPCNLVMQGNVFVNNTTKCENHPWRGRKSFETGTEERYAELYFTLHEPNGSYGPVILRDNIFVTGPECREAIHFHGGGHDIIVEGNMFAGAVNGVRVDPACTRMHIGQNPGMVLAPA